MKRWLALLFLLMSSAAPAQTTGTVDPRPATAQPSVKEDVPPGGCMPIGLTASGEIVFPIQCRELIERHRGAALEQKPAAVEEKPVAVEEKPVAVEEKPAAAEEKPVAVEAKPAAVEEKPATAEEKPATAEEKPAAKQSEAAAESSQPANEPVETAPPPRRAEPRGRAVSSNGCTHYRTYDRASGTYRSYDGQVRSCRLNFK
jgi:hypothetical protein